MKVSWSLNQMRRVRGLILSQMRRDWTPSLTQSQMERMEQTDWNYSF